jgi:hypothetical protein
LFNQIDEEPIKGDRMKKIMGWAVNIALLLTCSTVIIVIGVPYAKKMLSSPSAIPGKPLQLANANFGAAEKSLVVAMGVGCHFCDESAPFYKSILAQKTNVQIIAALPQSQESVSK